jgi:hypothetical protein
LRDRRFGQRRDEQPVRACARQVADDDPQRVAGANLVVPVRYDDHRAGSMDAAAEELEQIKRCLVRPVHVFEHDQRRRPLQLIQRCGKDVVAVRAVPMDANSAPLSLAGNVVQRREWPGRGEVVAAAPQAARDALPRAEFLQQHGLADARFAAYEHRAAIAAGRGAEPSQQLSKASIALEQFHHFLIPRERRAHPL